MTLDRPAALPPRWAEWLLRTLLSAEDRDCISGDLLEEYRQAIVPALGRGADADDEVESRPATRDRVHRALEPHQGAR